MTAVLSKIEAIEDEIPNDVYEALTGLMNTSEAQSNINLANHFVSKRETELSGVARATLEGQGFSPDEIGEMIKAGASAAEYLPSVVQAVQAREKEKSTLTESERILKFEAEMNNKAAAKQKEIDRAFEAKNEELRKKDEETMRIHLKFYAQKGAPKLSPDIEADLPLLLQSRAARKGGVITRNEITDSLELTSKNDIGNRLKDEKGNVITLDHIKNDLFAELGKSGGKQPVPPAFPTPGRFDQYGRPIEEVERRTPRPSGFA
ncbi:MAG TPA: hypothetical protein PKE69_27120, partial [Pyrinomonadaceae bacterium]|nr:hypothetical protein [Pyrinomonadaceae bacterium]